MKMQVVNCPNCNGEVQFDSTREYGFCTYCGTKIIFSHDSPANATQAFADNRTAALREMDKIMDHFDAVSSEFDELDSVSDRINALGRKNYNGLTGAWICFLSVAILCFICGGMSLGIGLTVVAAVFILAEVFGKKQDRQLMEDLIAERKRLSRILMEAYEEYPNCPVGIEYCRQGVLYDLYEYLRKGRAETIKEAINLLEADEHNAQMKQIAIDTQRIAQKNLEVNTVNMLNNVLK